MNLYCVIYVYILTMIVNSTKLFIISYKILDKKKPFHKEKTYLGGRSVSNRRPPGPQPGALTN